MVSPEDIKSKIREIKQAFASTISPEEQKEVKGKAKAVTIKAVGEGEKGSVIDRLRRFEQRLKSGKWKRKKKKKRRAAQPGTIKKKKRKKRRIRRVA